MGHFANVGKYFVTCDFCVYQSLVCESLRDKECVCVSPDMQYTKFRRKSFHSSEDLDSLQKVWDKCVTIKKNFF